MTLNATESNLSLYELQVRGILNKLTPEKFQKLSDDLLGLELDSDKVLKGVILLIFEKALDEPKYSSMYAQLCKRLSEEAPNFEPPGQPCTFKLLLLNKCRTEFENRAQVPLPPLSLSLSGLSRSTLTPLLYCVGVRGLRGQGVNRRGRGETTSRKVQDAGKY